MSPDQLKPNLYKTSTKKQENRFSRLQGDHEGIKIEIPEDNNISDSTIINRVFTSPDKENSSARKSFQI